jgi:hypothetical protein
LIDIFADQLLQQTSSRPAPLVVAYGLGVDSTAALIGLHRNRIRPDLILFADTGNERAETYAYWKVIQAWLRKVKFPKARVVRYVPQNFKNWPPYYSLGENCLTNGTLPSLAFGFKSCSLKWKVTPQNKFCDAWDPAVAAWRRGQKVRKIIGYDAGPRDAKRYAQAVGVEDPLYDYWYPLMDWGWDRERCEEEIRREGLPGWKDKTGQEWVKKGGVPVKSACYFCPATQPEELPQFKKVYLRYIVIMEARAEPRLTDIEGLWRNGVKGTRGGKYRPGKMTDFIREHGLLPAEEIDFLVESAPRDIVHNQQAFANGFEIPEWHDFLEAFTPEDGVDEIPLPKMVP